MVIIAIKDQKAEMIKQKKYFNFLMPYTSNIKPKLLLTKFNYYKMLIINITSFYDKST